MQTLIMMCLIIKLFEKTIEKQTSSHDKIYKDIKFHYVQHITIVPNLFL